MVEKPKDKAGIIELKYIGRIKKPKYTKSEGTYTDPQLRMKDLEKG